MSFSRSRTRRYLLQSLYSRSLSGAGVTGEEAFFEEPEKIDHDYANILEKSIISNEGKILSVIYECAPKYDVRSLPIVNALILYICLAEILLVCPDDVPPRVSVNEAIELAKRYSDDAGKNLINGIANTLLAKQQDLKSSMNKREPIEYSLFT